MLPFWWTDRDRVRDGKAKEQISGVPLYFLSLGSLIPPIFVARSQCGVHNHQGSTAVVERSDLLGIHLPRQLVLNGRDGEIWVNNRTANPEETESG